MIQSIINYARMLELEESLKFLQVCIEEIALDIGSFQINRNISHITCLQYNWIVRLLLKSADVPFFDEQEIKQWRKSHDLSITHRNAPIQFPFENWGREQTEEGGKLKALKFNYFLCLSCSNFLQTQQPAFSSYKELHCHMNWRNAADGGAPVIFFCCSTSQSKIQVLLCPWASTSSSNAVMSCAHSCLMQVTKGCWEEKGWASPQSGISKGRRIPFSW